VAYLHERTHLFTEELSLLHFAPEYALRRLSQLPNLRYLSADLDAPDAMEHFDITPIPHADDSCDPILCIQALEHVPDDRSRCGSSRACCGRAAGPSRWSRWTFPARPRTRTRR
jgi:hypothetical protein